MARSTYIYLAYSGDYLLGAWTVKHEMLGSLGVPDAKVALDPWTPISTPTGRVHVQRLKDGELRR